MSAVLLQLQLLIEFDGRETWCKHNSTENSNSNSKICVCFWPVIESFSDIQCVFLEDSRRHCIFL